MKITDLLDEKSIILDLKTENKEQTLNELIEKMNEIGNLTDKEDYKKIVFEREKQSTTGVGGEVAIPHGKGKSVKTAKLVAATIPDGVDYDSLDGQKVKLIFLIAAPEGNNNVHLEVLSKLSTLLMKPEFKKSLLEAKTPNKFLNVINKYEEEDEEKAEDNNKAQKYEILAITACTTGIAHTYMAAESLEQKGKEMGHLVKVETQGQTGVKNKLTKEEIENAKAIIIASDIKIDLDRFNGKKLLRVKVSEAIHKPEELIEKALSGDIKTYENKENKEDEPQEKVGGRIYKHLMSGVTHMLPFVVGGGILIAISFLIDDYSINPSNFGMNTPLAALFKTIGGYAFNFMLAILAGYIAYSIADRPGLAVGFVGGAIAINGTTFESLKNSDITLVSSGFLGALIAGFIGGYIVIFLRKIFSFLPKSLEGMKPILIYPVAGIFLMGVIMIFINPAIAGINTALNNFLASMSNVNKVILGAILAGMMSVDLGGPCNKAAYTFGTGMLASGQYEIMAAVMAGGMVAPLAIAILATFFKRKLPKKERQSALLNYIMGAAFITEGAIPFASQDPIRVLVSCIIGSGITGGLSMLFNCTLMAPHGGIFVLPVVGNAWMYLLSIIIGSVVAALLMAVLKKNVWEE